jgi:hypothetical protein
LDFSNRNLKFEGAVFFGLERLAGALSGIAFLLSVARLVGNYGNTSRPQFSEALGFDNDLYPSNSTDLPIVLLLVAQDRHPPLTSPLAADRREAPVATGYCHM